MPIGAFAPEAGPPFALTRKSALTIAWRLSPDGKRPIGRNRRQSGEEQGFCHMSRRCELSGKAVLTGNTVSHANNKARRRFLPNLNQVTLISDALKQNVRLRISAHALRSVEARGGLDAYLLKARDSELSARALKLKRQIAKRTEVTEEAAKAS